MWTDKYVGLPFKPDGRDYDGMDCWGLIWLIYRDEFGIILPKYDGVYTEESPNAVKRAHNTISTFKNDVVMYKPVTILRERDFILLRMHGNIISHVGLYVGDGQMLHIMSGIDSTVEKVSSIRWRSRVAEIRRYVGNS